MKRFPALLLALLIPMVPAGAEEVVADDVRDVFAISGAILVDGSFAEAREAAACDACHWRIITVCEAGSLDERLGCSYFPCPSNLAVAEVWRASGASAPPPGDPTWSYRGLTCLDETPMSATVASTAARDMAVRAVPPLRPAAQPMTGLTGLPLYFRSGQPAAITTAPASVGGTVVTVHATPTWTWDFGHGPLHITTNPGGRWPTGRVLHTYPRRGLFRIRVTCTWRAVYDARGITDLPVDGVITQSAWFDLRVREARRFLRTTQGA